MNVSTKKNAFAVIHASVYMYDFFQEKASWHWHGHGHRIGIGLAHWTGLDNGQELMGMDMNLNTRIESRRVDMEYQERWTNF